MTATNIEVVGGVEVKMSILGIRTVHDRTRLSATRASACLSRT